MKLFSAQIFLSPSQYLTSLKQFSSVDRFIYICSAYFNVVLPDDFVVGPDGYQVCYLCSECSPVIWNR